jgi:hypothetical protein
MSLCRASTLQSTRTAETQHAAILVSQICTIPFLVMGYVLAHMHAHSHTTNKHSHTTKNGASKK